MHVSLAIVWWWTGACCLTWRVSFMIVVPAYRAAEINLSGHLTFKAQSVDTVSMCCLDVGNIVLLGHAHCAPCIAGHQTPCICPHMRFYTSVVHVLFCLIHAALRECRSSCFPIRHYQCSRLTHMLRAVLQLQGKALAPPYPHT